MYDHTGFIFQRDIMLLVWIVSMKLEDVVDARAQEGVHQFRSKIMELIPLSPKHHRFLLSRRFSITFDQNWRTPPFTFSWQYIVPIAYICNEVFFKINSTEFFFQTKRVIWYDTMSAAKIVHKYAKHANWLIQKSNSPCFQKCELQVEMLSQHSKTCHNRRGWKNRN